MSDAEENEDLPQEDSRRSFLKKGLKGALLLPYVAPTIESVFLSPTEAGADDDDDDSSGGGRGIPPSQIGNNPPPPGNSSGNSSNSDDDDDDDGGGRKFGEPPNNR